jgi:hypothetical protein
MDDVDQCPNTPIAQAGFVDSTGCAPNEIDLDGDGVTSDLDWNDADSTQWADGDGDGYGDNTNEIGGDDCPSQNGNSTIDKLGCTDYDGDGYSDQNDAFPSEKTQWNDTDADGYGDNWNNENWTEGRLIGQYIEAAMLPDRCPELYSNFAEEYEGCLDIFKTDTTGDKVQSNVDDEGGLDTLTIIIIAAGGFVLILLGVVLSLLKNKKKPQPSKKNPQPNKKKPQSIKKLAVIEKITMVATWEDLPAGDWLPDDDSGVNWYLDNDGQHWHSTENGFEIWKE